MKDISILLVVDGRNLRHTVSSSLVQWGARVESVASIAEARRRLSRATPHFLILDVDGQEEDVLSFLSELDSLDLETLVLSEDTQTERRIECFQRGVLDIIPKPLDLRELDLRLRRFTRPKRAVASSMNVEIACGLATLDITHRQLRNARRKPIPLTASEFRLLYLLLQNEMRVVERADIVREILGQGQDSLSRSIDVMVSKLRRKMQDAGSERYIRSVRSEGYMLIGEERLSSRLDDSEPDVRALLSTT